MNLGHPSPCRSWVHEMSRKRKILSVAHALVLAMGGTAFLAKCSATSDEHALRYRIALHVHTKDDKPLLKLRIWLPYDEPTKSNLLKLCEMLREMYKKEGRIEADVFSSEEGAKKFSDVYEFPGYTKYYSTWRARYWIDRMTGQEYLEFCEGPNQIGKPMLRILLGGWPGRQVRR